MSQHNFDRPVGHIVQELAIVGNQDHRAPVILQVTLKPLD